MSGYQYPMSMDWTTEEIIDVVLFFELVEKAYEKGVSKEDLLKGYRRFKEIVPSKSEEKQVCNEFEESSGFSTYRVVTKAKELDSKIIKM